MKILFFGSSEFSVPFLEEIDRSRHNITSVITTVDKQAGRGKKVTSNIVKDKAIGLSIDYIQIENLDNDFIDKFLKIEFDCVVVVSFGMILPERIFKLAPVKWLNVHPSLLPKYRGPAPIISTLLNGDKIGGVSINEVVYEVDAGHIYAQVQFKVEEDDNRDSLESKSIKFGKGLLTEVLDLIEEVNLKPYPQDEGKIIYTNKITKEDLKINWNSSAEKIINKIRAFSSSPGAYCFWKGARIKILKASVLSVSESSKFIDIINANKKNGLVLKADKKSGILINCIGREIIEVETLQPQGKKAMSGSDFINGYRLKVGENFE